MQNFSCDGQEMPQVAGPACPWAKSPERRIVSGFAVSPRIPEWNQTLAESEPKTQKIPQTRNTAPAVNPNPQNCVASQKPKILLQQSPNSIRCPKKLTKLIRPPLLFFGASFPMLSPVAGDAKGAVEGPPLPQLRLSMHFGSALACKKRAPWWRFQTWG